jgi:hypothetical protein
MVIAGSMKIVLPELFADPFQEHASIIARPPQALLGARFTFESNSRQLLRIVDCAFAHLPRQRLPAAAPALRVRLLLGSAAVGRARAAPALLETFSAHGMVGGATGKSNLVMLRFAYHLRYELLEFAVYTLAARVNQLVSLHAACVGLGGHAVLLMGSSGAGKSTIALQCLQQKLQFVSEDSTLVAPATMHALGLANFLHVRDDSLQWIPARAAAAIRTAPVITRRSGMRKFEVDLRRAGHRLAGSALKLKGTVFLCAQHAAGGPLLRRLPRRELVARLTAAQAFAAGQPHWAAFCRQAARIGGFELRRGAHPLEAVQCLRELLAQRGP